MAIFNQDQRSAAAVDGPEIVWQAQGVLMEIHKISAPQALKVIEWHAQMLGKTTAEVCLELLHDASRGQPTP
ncbi:ANTAR domain-containing protein [Kribbella amoyensis]|uniref:ANTAR domain-containing protein n=1 Tax=Kribbella amoyensis TaxID=996641 RepID=UPI00119F5786|nr:ANTAR domain-containing protein [Kribbella amoyensis]